MTTADRRAVLALVNVIVEAAKEAKVDGHDDAPLTPLFMAFSEIGVSYREFEGLVEIAVQSGAIVRHGAGAIYFVADVVKPS
jgi:hypothetical protein